MPALIDSVVSGFIDLLIQFFMLASIDLGINGFLFFVSGDAKFYNLLGTYFVDYKRQEIFDLWDGERGLQRMENQEM